MGRAFFGIGAAGTTQTFSGDYPDYLDGHALVLARRRTLAALQRAFTQNDLPQPIKVLQPIIPVRPDRIDRPKTQQQQYFATSPQPERKAPLADVIYPDRGDQGRRQLERRRLPVSEQDAFTQNDLPQPIKLLQPVIPYRPDTVDRRKMHASLQRAFFANDLPQPIRILQPIQPTFLDRFTRAMPQHQQPSFVQLQTATTPFDWLTQIYVDRFVRLVPQQQEPAFVIVERTAPIAAVAFPDRVDRPRSQQQIYFALAPQPELTVPLDWDTSYPDWLPRLRAQQQPFTMAPQPEVPAPLDWDVTYSDAIVRPKFLTALQPFFATSSQPEETSQWVDVRYPDRVDRSRTQQQQYFAMAPQPEQTSQWVDVRYPDRIDRPRVQQQQYFATSMQPERSVPLVEAEYPDIVRRPAAQQQLAWLYPLQQPVAAVTIYSVTYPDRIDRPRAQQQQASTFSPQPEITSPLDFYVSYPDRLPTLRAQQTAFFSPVQPERTTPIAVAIYPDGIARPSRQQTFVSFAPQPEQTSPNDWCSVYPDRLPRIVPQQQPFAAPIAPERTASLVDVRYPDRVDRSRAQQQAFATSPQPEITSPLDFYVSYPDRLPRLASQHLAFTTPIAPERTAPLADVVFPSRIDRPRAQQQQAFATSSQPEESVQLDWQPRYTDRLPRLVPQYPAFFFAPQPERSSPLATAIFPDYLRRIVPQQLAFVGMQPEVTAPRDFYVSHPDKLPRLVPQQSAFVMAPQPERAAPIAAVIYPDRIDRPKVHASIQQAFAISPQPEQTIELGWDAFFPDRAARAKTPANTHLFFVFAPQPEAPVPFAPAIYPTRIDRQQLRQAFVVAVLEQQTTPFFQSAFPLPTRTRASQQSSFFASPQPEQTIELDWQAYYPDRIERPTMRTSLQQATAFDPQPEQQALGWQAIYVDRVERAFAKPALYQAFAFDPFPIPNPPPPPPPPPPVPERLPIRIEQVQIPLGGGGGGWIVHAVTPRSWPDSIKIELPKPPARKDSEFDYALLPLGSDEAPVLALANGNVETFTDKGGALVVRLTADDGTMFYYAKLKRVRKGRVKQGQQIGVTESSSILPAALPSPSEEKKPAAPAVFGVLPVKRAPAPPAPDAPPLPEPPKQLAAPPTTKAIVRTKKKPTLGDALAQGAAIVAGALGIAWIIRTIRNAPPPKPKKKRRRRRRR